MMEPFPVFNHAPHMPGKTEAAGIVFRPGEWVLLRDSDDARWRPGIYERHNPCGDYNHMTSEGAYKQCIPYRGNERLLGKTGRPDCEPDGKTGERNND